MMAPVLIVGTLVGLRYLRENCDYAFETLKTNLPKAMAAVHLTRWDFYYVGQVKM